MKKRIISFVLALAMLLGTIPSNLYSVGFAAGPDESEEIGGTYYDLTWTLSDGNYLTITGNTWMADESSAEDYPWYPYRKQVQYMYLDVPNVGDHAFEGFTNLGFYMESSLISIGDFAFAGCTKLGTSGPEGGGNEIYFNEDLAYIGECAFAGCKGISSVVFKGNAPYIEPNAFDQVNMEAAYSNGIRTWTEDRRNDYGGNIAWIGIDFYLPQIIASGFCGDNVTWELDSAGTLTISGSGKMDDYVYDWAVYPSTPWGNYAEFIRAIFIEEGVTSIGDAAFWRTYYPVFVEIPETVTSIGNHAFDTCSFLANVILPSNLKSIGYEAFDACYGDGFTKVHIPASVEDIGSMAFTQTWNLEEITVDKDNRHYQAIDNILYTYDLNTLLTAAPYGTPETIVIDGQVTKEVGDLAFAQCRQIKSVVITEGVEQLGMNAFFQCRNIDDLVLPSTINSCDDSFMGCPLTNITFTGDAPQVSNLFNEYHTGTAYYPANNATWTTDAMNKLGGSLTWLPYTEDEEGEYHNTLDELTTLDYLAFAQVAYEDFNVGETVQECLVDQDGNKWDDVWGEDGITYAELCEGIAQWEVIHIEFDYVGFYAVAFGNDNGEAVIAYRGSKPLTSALDLITTWDGFYDWVINDFPLILFNKETFGSQYEAAIDMYDYVVDLEEVDKVAVTGHSLGGLLADIVSAYSGCRGETINAISALDVLYYNHPEDLGSKFQGMDRWNFIDHANICDVLAGTTERQMPGYIATEIKPYYAYQTNYGALSFGGNHSLNSIVCRDENGVVSMNKIVDEMLPTSGVSNHMSFTAHSVDLGVSGKDYFDKGLSLGLARTSYGGDGNDEIITSTLDDVLVGGPGHDDLDGGWGDDTYYYFKGDGLDTIWDISGKDKLYLEGFADSDLISVYDDESDFISISCNGKTILYIYNKRSTSIFNNNSFKIFVNGGQENDITEYFSKYLSGSRLLIQCPVSVDVLDPDGNVVYTLKDGSAGKYYTDYGNFYVFEEEDGGYGKVLDLLEGYSVRIIGEDTGVMDVLFQQVEDGELTEPKRITDIPVSKSIAATIEKRDNGDLVLSVDTDQDGIGDQEALFGSDACDDGHEYESVITPPSCEKPGFTTHTCTKCGAKVVDAHVDELGHTEEAIPGNAATCTDDGLTDGKKCSVCGTITVAQDIIAAKGHDHKATVTQPTCTAGGYTTYTCACGDSYVDSKVDKLGHNMSAWSVVDEANCTADGNKRRDCDRCDYFETEAIKASGHKIVTVLGAAASCTESGLTDGMKCSICGTVTVAQETIPAKGHTEVAVAGKDSTCTSSGLTAGKKCSTCGTFIVPQNTIPAKGHVWKNATCTAPKTCSVCGATSGKKAAHTYDDMVDGTCNMCGVHRETVETRKVHHMLRMYNPNTGEHFYTGSEVERDDLIAAGWNYEGVAFTFPANTGAPVYRLFEPATGEHLYTMDEAEKAKLEAEGWNYEGIAFNSAYDTEAVQHRLYNPNTTVGAYHFTFSEEEMQNLIDAGWWYQGIGWYSCWK